MAITRQNIQPEALATPSRSGHTLYSHVVSVEGRRLIFAAGQLARDRAGNVVGKGAMRAQIRQVGENIKAALAAAGATPADIVKANTRATDQRASYVCASSVPFPGAAVMVTTSRIGMVSPGCAGLT